MYLITLNNHNKILHKNRTPETCLAPLLSSAMDSQVVSTPVIS